MNVIRAKLGMAFEPTDIDTIYAAVGRLRDDLQRHRSWLQTPDGQSLPGAEIVIAEIDKEIEVANNLVHKIFMHSFVGKS